MSLQEIFDDFLEENPDTFAALLVDDGGETAAIASSGDRALDLEVLAAYLSIRMRRLVSLAAITGSAAVQRLHVEHQGAQILVVTLPDGYLAAVVQEPDTPLGGAWVRLQKMLSALREEAFPE